MTPGAAGRSGRETGIELLRILAMLGIMASHFACYGAGGGGAGAGGLWLALLQAGGKLGVDIFVLISGYFLIKAPAVRTEKALRLWAAMFFYSLGLYLLGVGCGLVPFGRMALLEHLMPLCTSRWWFASCYLLLYLLSPFLNRLLGALRREEYLRLLGLGLVFWCLLPCLTGYAIDKGQVGWFVLLYALAGFLRLHCDLSRLRAGRCLGWAAGFVLLAFALYRGFGVLSARWGFLARRCIPPLPRRCFFARRGAVSPGAGGHFVNFLREAPCRGASPFFCGAVCGMMKTGMAGRGGGPGAGDSVSQRPKGPKPQTPECPNAETTPGAPAACLPPPAPDEHKGG